MILSRLSTTPPTTVRALGCALLLTATKRIVGRGAKPGATRRLADRRRAGLHGDRAGRQFCEKGEDLAPPQLLAHNDLAGSVNAVDPKHALREIKPARSSPIVLTSFMDGSFASGQPTATTIWHLDAVWGRPPHYQQTISELTASVRLSPVSGHRRRKNVSDSKSGHPMSAFPPIPDGFRGATL